MNEFETYEYTVSQKIQGIYWWGRVSLIVSYVLYVVLAFLAGLLTRLIAPFLAFVPLSTWMLVFFTWRYVNIDYEYSITSGNLTFSKIYGNRTRKSIAEFKLREAAFIGPLNNRLHMSRYEAWGAQNVYYALSCSSAEDAYVALYTNQDNQRCAFLFEATNKSLKIFRFYNPSATVLFEVKY